MQIESLTIRGFRCFDQEGETIHLNKTTCFVGPNASGKTAAMIAIARIFGETSSQRQIVPSDFYVPEGEVLKSVSSRNLLIECRLSFPELSSHDASESPAIPETFNQMIVNVPGGTPFCRIRLDARWEDDGSAYGDIEQSLSWILTDSDDPDVISNGKQFRLKPGDRGKVRLVYVPAARDPEHQIRATTATSFGRLISSLEWAGADLSLKEKLADLKDEFGQLRAIQTLNTHVQDAWKGLYQGRIANEMVFQAIEEEPAALLKLLAPTFRPNEEGRAVGAGELSDGLRSLFSFSLTLGLFQVENLLRSTSIDSGFRADLSQDVPLLTIFAIEEPENHLSPHYLGNVLSKLIETGTNDRAQILLSSHSPSVLARVEPEDVRYFLGHEHAVKTHVLPIPLPAEESEEAFKYVREAVRGYPELYFSRLVVLGEGATEQIILKRIFEANGTPLDTHFISVVPLGGRHVNHFWRLLHGLNIPFITLLDLDKEKEGAGWGRIKYIRDQLILRYGKGDPALNYVNDDGNVCNLEDSGLDGLGKKLESQTDEQQAWLAYFENTFNVYFSSPLDLDFAMLEAFPAVYKGLSPKGGGPKLGDPDSKEYSETLQKRMRLVLASDPMTAKEDLGASYNETQWELFSWYKYLFIDNSKPVSHMRALLQIEDDELTSNQPAFLDRLIDKVKILLK